MIFFGKIEEGELKIKNRQKMLEYMKTLPDGWYRLELKKKNQRSLPQNAYYWAVIIWEIRKQLEDLGNIFTHEDVHMFLKDKFNAKQVVGPGGELLGEVGGSTTELSKEDFGIYIEKIIAWASEFLNLNIPPPNSQSSLQWQ